MSENVLESIAKANSGFTWEVSCIEDGLAQPGFIEAVPGLHGECLFTFVPVWPEVFEKFEDEKEKAASVQTARAMVGQFLAKFIKKWSLVDSRGEAVAINEVNCRKLRTSIQTKLYQIIVGVKPTDLHPEWISAKRVADGTESLLSDLAPMGEQIKN